MSGSQQFQVMKHVSDSLAGRVVLLELFPFAHAKIVEHQTLSLPELI